MAVLVLGEILYSYEAPRHHVDMLYELSPNFMKLIEVQAPDCSVRRSGEWLGLDISRNAQTVMNEISRRKVQR
jgi:hypothetical protein